MKKRKKYGFTLIELLVVIVLLALIFSISIYFIGNAFNGVASKIDKTTKNIILDAANEYVLEYRNKGEWKENLSSKGDITFCVSLNSLIDTGYYDYDDEYIVENKDKILVSVVINSKKVFNYDLIDYDDAESRCGYKLNDSVLDKNHNNVELIDKENNYVGDLEYNVDKIDNNNYNVDISFLTELEMQNISINLPVYVVLVLDNSGSMIDNDGWNSAKNAAINLSNSIINNLEGSMIALIQYDDTPMLVRGFKNEPLTNFELPDGGTNVSGSLDLAVSLYLAEQIPSDAMVYTILLYDGIPAYRSYLKDLDGNSVYNSSVQLYYNNFLTAFKSANSNYKHYVESPQLNGSSELWHFTNRIYNYIKNASDYLKNNINSKLITVGYDFSDASSEAIMLKELSSIDNEFCSDSSYIKEVEKDTGLLSVDKVNMKTQQVVYPFTFDESNKNLTSFSNSDIGMTETYGYFELDLTEYESTDLIDLVVDYTGYGHIAITDSNDRVFNVMNDSGCLENNISYNGLYYCLDSDEKLFQTSIYGGKQYYIHISVLNNVSNYSRKLIINDIYYSKASDVTLYDSAVDGYNKDSLITLSTNEESRVVFEPVIDESSLVLSGKYENSLSGGYEKIDLSEKDGTYLLTVNASISNSGLGIVAVSNSEMPPLVPTYAEQSVGVHTMYYNDSDYSVLSGCNQENLRCIVGNNSAREFSFKLDGGNVYYVHFIYDVYNDVYGKVASTDNFRVNSISLLKFVGDIDVVENEKFQEITDTNCNNDSLGIIGCLNGKDTYNFKLNHDNVSIISDNKEMINTCSHSYSELDLSSYDSSKLYAVSFRTSFDIYGFSSFNQYKSSDYGNIIITNSSNVPSLTGNSSFSQICDINDLNNKCVAMITASNGSREYFVNLEGGQKYYVHYMFCKVNGTITSGSDDYLSINKIAVYETEDEISTEFPNDVINYNDYSFEEKDGFLVSTNTNIGNSLSHSYLKINLSEYTSDDRFRLEIDDYCSHGDTSVLILRKSAVVPEFFARVSSDLMDIKKYSCNDLESSYEKDLVGGAVYYLHFLFVKNAVGDINDDIYRTDNVKLIKKNDEVINLDLSSVKGKNNYSFVKDEIDGESVYISSNTDLYSYSYSYFELDLTSYSSDRNFMLHFDKSVEGSGKYRIYPTESSIIPTYLTGNSSNIINDNYSNPKDMELVGGKKYYVHILGFNDNSSGKVIINDIVLSELVSEGDAYCYYDSSSESINSLFGKISNKIETSAPKVEADKVKITFSTYKDENVDVVFHIEDKNGELVDEIYIEKDISDSIDNIFEMSGNDYKFVLDEVNCAENKCEFEIKLFKVKVEFLVSNNPNASKVIELTDEQIPTVKINYENGEAIN